MKEEYRSPNKRVVVVAARRSALSKIPGAFSQIQEVDLLASVFQVVSEGLHMWIDSAITGSAFPVERDNLCRKAILALNSPINIDCTTISKTCASSDEALYMAFTKIISGKSQAVLVGGCEKVSNSQYILRYMKDRVKNASKGQLLCLSDIENNFGENDMHYIAEILANRKYISREEQDIFAIKSRLKARMAYKNHRFDKEILPIHFSKNDNDVLCIDELTQQTFDEKKIHTEKPIFLQDGALTNYNTSQMCDCAVAMVLMNYDMAQAAGIKCLVEIKDVSSICVAKADMGNAMEQCIEKILNENHLRKNDIDLYEINESFAVQAIATIKALKINSGKVNVNGGNLALGYPIGASGMRMCVTLIYEMLRINARYGISTMCSGGTMANAILFENKFAIKTDDTFNMR